MWKERLSKCMVWTIGCNQRIVGGTARLHSIPGGVCFTRPAFFIPQPTIMSSKAARFQLTWASSEKPGGKTGDEAILEWLQTPRNAARYIRLWNNIAEADSKATFSAELTTFVNNNSSPQRTPSSVQKRVQRFDELLKESKALLSSGASERGKVTYVCLHVSIWDIRLTKSCMHYVM